MLAEIAPEETVAVLEELVMELLDQARIDRPPVDALRLAGSLGMTVAMDDRQQGRARFVRLAGRGGRPPRATILLRPDDRPERYHWSVAHEIGESQAYRVFHALGVDPREAPPAAREAVANRLAGRLLLPGRWFAVDGSNCDWDLLELKRRYRTASHELIARRMLEMPPAVIVSIFDQCKLTMRRSNVRGRVPGLSAAEVESRDIAHRHGRPHYTYDGLLVVRSWPVHEPGWRREIIRAEVEEL